MHAIWTVTFSAKYKKYEYEYTDLQDVLAKFRVYIYNCKTKSIRIRNTITLNSNVYSHESKFLAIVRK